MARPKQASQRVIAYAAKRGMTPAMLSPEEYAAARGHRYTPEHGGPLTGIPRHYSSPGREVYTTGSDYRADQILFKAAEHQEHGEHSRVVVKVHVAGEGWRTIGGGKGYSASYLADKSAQAGGIREALLGGYVGGSSGGGGGDSDGVDDLEYDDIDGWQLDELT